MRTSTSGVSCRGHYGLRLVPHGGGEEKKHCVMPGKPQAIAGALVVSMVMGMVRTFGQVTVYNSKQTACGRFRLSASLRTRTSKDFQLPTSNPASYPHETRNHKHTTSGHHTQHNAGSVCIPSVLRRTWLRHGHAVVATATCAQPSAPCSTRMHTLLRSLG